MHWYSRLCLLPCTNARYLAGNVTPRMPSFCLCFCSCSCLLCGRGWRDYLEILLSDAWSWFLNQLTSLAYDGQNSLVVRLSVSPLRPQARV